MPDRPEQSDGSVADAASDDQAPQWPPHGRGPVIVGIGASAGGLSALRKLFSKMPPDAGIAYVVVVHLSPEHESHLHDLLQPHCPMPVLQVTETLPLEVDRVYVIPPNANLNTIDTHLRLTELEEHRRERAPIDHFFRTLASTHDGHSVGIVLTGTGSDGTQGLRRIKECGGVTIVQDPDEAEYDGMPRSALAGGVVDLTLPLAKIPPRLVEIARTEPRVQAAVTLNGDDDERLLQQVFARVRARTGHDFSQYKRTTILRRIGRRMQLNECASLEAYVEQLRSDAKEVTGLFDDLLITVTQFFRDEEVFRRLGEDTVAGLFEGHGPDRPLRVWSVGCSTGEEAYSLAMLLLEEAGRREVYPQIQVFASDLHEHSLGRAREGVYPGSIASDVSPERLRRFFVQDDGSFRVRKDVRELVVFANHNLLKDPPFSHLDLIVCRNVMIYLQRRVQEDVVALFHYALNPDGLLLLGTAETVEGSELFRSEDKSLCLYRRRGVPTREPRLPVFPFAPRPLAPGEEAEPPPSERSTSSFGELHARIVERYAPPSLLVDEHHEIVHNSLHAGQYLSMPGGEPTSNLFKLVREELRVELRAVIHAARESGSEVRSKAVDLEIDGRRRQVVLRVHPARDPELAGFLLVIFDAADPAAGPDSDAEGGAEGANRELEAELVLTKQRLQSVIEEHETAQEEMRASNEEMQSSNEELRSTLEELETSKEELQSMNEELTTVNQENRHRVEELSQLSSDLHNLLAATDIATLFLDRQLRIVRFTPQVSELFNIRNTDKGRPLSDLTHRLADGELGHDAERVLDRLTPVEREVASDDGRWFILRVLPYRSADDRIEGVVVTLIDVTARREAEEALRQANHQLEQRVAERTRELDELTQRLRQLARQLGETERRERKHLASLLHDGLQQELIAIKLQVETLVLGDDGRPAAEVLTQISERIDEAMAASRDLTRQLRPPALYEGGLMPALRWLVGEYANRMGLRVDLRGPSEPLDLADSARSLIYESVRELLLNVVKHAGVGDAAVIVEVDRGRLRVEVSDRGVGFNSGQPIGTGAGMGVFSVHERLAALGGTLEVHSGRGDGTHAILEIPTELMPQPISDDAHPDRAAGDGESRDAPPGICRVLIVDDHALVRKALVSMLDRHPKVTIVGEAGDGVEALEAIGRHRPDVVLLDLNLPKINGVEVARQVRHRWPEVRIIGLSVPGRRGDAADDGRGRRKRVRLQVRRRQDRPAHHPPPARRHAADVRGRNTTSTD